MKNFKDINWLVDNLANEKLIVIDTRGELESKEIGYNLFRKSHLKNARYMSLDDHMTGEVGQHGGRHPLVDLDDFKDKLEDIGVSNDSLVLIYDDGQLPMASRLWYLLKYIGKEEVYILKGGFPEVLARGLDLEEGDGLQYQRGHLDIRLQEDILVDMDYVKDQLKKGNIVVDSRSRERYEGIVEPIDRIAGHIPGCINYPWMDLMDLDYDLDKIRKHFSGLGQDDFVVHCGSGVTGCVNFIFMDEVNLKAKLYLGGYSDWISYENNEIAKS